jgi:hypothetical protein
MKLFIWLLTGSFMLHLLLFGVATIFHPSRSFAFFPIFPAIWIAMAVGGVHSAGPLSFIAGVTVMAFAYALFAWSAVRFWSIMRLKLARSVDPSLTNGKTPTPD